MPKVKFGRKDELAITLRESPNMFVVRTRSAPRARSHPVLSPVAAQLRDAQLVLAFPEANVELYRVTKPVNAKSLAARKAALRALPEVRFAGGVLIDEGSGEPVVYTENIFIKFVDSIDPNHCRAVIEEAGLSIKQQLNYAQNAFFTAAPEGTGQKVFDIALSLLKRPDVEYCHPEIVRRRARKRIFPRQWHLKRTTIDGIDISASANIEAAHKITTGEGVTIAIIDDGVDIDHPEFSIPGKIVAPRDVLSRSDNPRPRDPDPNEPDDHGTACAGVACAAGRDGASGVAPGARLMPIRIPFDLGSQQEANAFHWAVDHGADVISCSWGGEDGDWDKPKDPRHRGVTHLPPSTRLAIDYAVTKGRDGRGCVVLFAAGNGNESVDNDGYPSYRRVIGVAACNDRGQRSVYSEYGKAIWCSFPSDDEEWSKKKHPAPLTPGIWTTDRIGDAGYNSGRTEDGDAEGNYTNGFGGTSSACPGAAGVAALILSANPDLRWDEVRDIMRRACDVIDPKRGKYDVHGHSIFYGYGRLNGAKAVALARSTAGDRIQITRRTALPASLQPFTIRFYVGEDLLAESIAVRINTQPDYNGRLALTLRPPPGAGAKPIVLDDATNNNAASRTFSAAHVPNLAKLRRKPAKGIWHLDIQNRGARTETTPIECSLELGVAPNDRKVRAGSRSNAKRQPRAYARRRRTATT